MEYSENTKYIFSTEFEFEEDNVDFEDIMSEKDLEEDFRSFYKERKENRELPSWIYGKVDNRLLALGYIPEEFYEDLKKDYIKKRKDYKNLRKRRIKEFLDDKERIDILSYIIGANLYSIEENEGSLEEEISYFIYPNKDGEDFHYYSYEDLINNLRGGLKEEIDEYEENEEKKQIFEKIHFINYEILEKDEFDIQESPDKDGFSCSSLGGLAVEVYKLIDGYEIHQLFMDRYSYFYSIIIKCEDIEIEKMER